MLIAGLFRGDGDSTADGVSAVQGALWASKDFNLLNIKKLLIELGRIGQQDPIDQDRRRQFAITR